MTQSYMKHCRNLPSSLSSAVLQYLDIILVLTFSESYIPLMKRAASILFTPESLIITKIDPCITFTSNCNLCTTSLILHAVSETYKRKILSRVISRTPRFHLNDYHLVRPTRKASYFPIISLSIYTYQLYIAPFTAALLAFVMTVTAMEMDWSESNT